MTGAVEGGDLGIILGAIFGSFAGLSGLVWVLFKILRAVQGSTPLLEQIDARTHSTEQRIIAVENAATAHNLVAKELGDRVTSLEKAGERRHVENGIRLTAIEDRLAAVESAQKTAAGVAEDTEARHNKETS